MSKKSYLKRAKEVLKGEIDGLNAVRNNLGDTFVSLVDACLAALQRNGKLVLTGVGKSGHVGVKIAATLSSTGSPAVFLHPVEAMHGDLGLLGPNDLLIALSYSGETDELLAVLPAAKRFNVPIAAITGNDDSSLSRWSDLTVTMAVPREACPFNLAPTTSTTALLALGDALALVLLDCRGFAKHDYARLHPAGAIGRSITLSVADIMRTGDRCPRVTAGTTVRQALLLMTRARCGSVAVVDSEEKLLGIFTDGDFRRHIMRDIRMMEEPIQDVMTKDPITIKENALAIEMMKLIEKQSIDDVLVVNDKGQVVGIVDTQDLPKFKLM
ncbi:MAG: KpsF/GutQ family sugar-phosphate isomerase [Candidatus Pacebacteria bacterium]|nr:KpsF/GutQ family sugar-phosphate isomerase [Candidatus Paceibacterota bacterium]